MECLYYYLYIEKLISVTTDKEHIAYEIEASNILPSLV